MNPIHRLLTNTQKKRIEQKQNELNRLFHLPDKALGQELISLSQQAWEGIKSVTKNEDEIALKQKTYEGHLLLILIPDLAVKLGYHEPVVNQYGESIENFRNSLATKSGVSYRNAAGCIVLNTPFINPSLSKNDNAYFAYQLLTNEPCNGNPIAFAIDRLFKPIEPIHADDWFAKGVQEVSRLRGVPSTCWTPAMQNEKAGSLTNPFFSEGEMESDELNVRL